DVEKQITQLWEAGDAWRDVMPVAQAHDLVRSVIAMLDRGEVRVAEIGEDVVVNEWVKLAILMWFRLQEMQIIEAGPFEYVDKLPLKKGYKAAGVRVVPCALILRTLAEGEEHDKLKLNALLREHGVVS